MEWLAIALSSLLAILSPVNLIGDKLIADNIRSLVHDVEALSVRVDNAPNFQLAQGKVQRIRIASEGLEIIPAARVEKFQLETDPISLDLRALTGGGSVSQLRAALREPLQAASEIVLTEQDINHALADPEIQAQLEAVLNRVIPEDAPRFQLLGAELNLLADNQIQLDITLRQGNDDSEAETLNLRATTEVEIIRGEQLTLKNPSAELNGRKLSSRIVNSIVGSFSDRLSLKRLEIRGITARVIRYELTPDQLAVSAFVSIVP